MTKPDLVAACSGTLFGTGLVISGMADPQKVQNFLDLTGTWDPTLAFVMGGALLVAMPAFTLVLRRRGPMLGGSFQLPSRKDIDLRLLAGAALFGIGWGLSGYCPGPAIASLASWRLNAVLIVLAMVGGALLHDHVLAHKNS